MRTVRYGTSFFSFVNQSAEGEMGCASTRPGDRGVCAVLSSSNVSNIMTVLPRSPSLLRRRQLLECGWMDGWCTVHIGLCHSPVTHILSYFESQVITSADPADADRQWFISCVCCVILLFCFFFFLAYTSSSSSSSFIVVIVFRCTPSVHYHYIIVFLVLIISIIIIVLVIIL